MAESKLNRKYGWIPDRPDTRDLKYATVAPKALQIPAKVDLRSFCSTVEDQGSIGSCTANALAGNLEFLMRKFPNPEPPPVTVRKTWWQKLIAWIQGKPLTGAATWTDISRLFIYYNERVLIGSAHYDSGAFLRDGIKTLNQLGWCYESTWKYDTSKVYTKPSPEAYAEAKNHLISSYYRINTLDEMLTCLADGYPFVFGITLYESFESSKVRDTGVVDMPKPTEGQIGGHAMCAVGYDLATKRFLVRNSWGTHWGDFGYCTIPFQYFTELGADFWTVRR